MRLVFLGSGSAFTVGDNYHSNMMLEDEKGEKLLIDCGSDIRFSLHALGYSYEEIDHVYISHLHGDHCGGLEWLGLTRKFDKTCDKPCLHLHSSLVSPLWDSRLKGGMQTLHDEIATLETYFEINAFEKFFEWQGLSFDAVETKHVCNGPKELPSYGLNFSLGKQSIFITTDTRFVPEEMNALYRSADLIFHDCETASKRSGVHAHYDELKTLPLQIKQKMWLYHYNPGPLPDPQADGFLGFVKRGQIFDFPK